MVYKKRIEFFFLGGGALDLIREKYGPVFATLGVLQHCSTFEQVKV